MDRRRIKKCDVGYNPDWHNTEEANKANRIFKTKEELQKAIDGYFAECDASGKLYSADGLCLYLSLHNSKKRTVSRETLQNWLHGKKCEEYQEIVQLASLRMGEQLETDPRYQDKSMINRMLEQKRQVFYGDWRRNGEQNNGNELTLNIKMGANVQESDCK